LILSSVALTALPAPAQAGGQGPEFYTPPSPLPDGGPGTLIRSEKFGFGGPTKPAAGTRGWKVLYKSQDALGNSVAVSGSVLLPATGDDATRPIVGVAVGTHGLGDSCAPSRLLESGAEPELQTIRDLLARGYGVAVSDYQGLGTPGEHVYGVNIALGRNVLDSIRAARNLSEAGLPADGQTAVMGYSQGGGAAAAAAEQADAYAPDLGVDAALAGGVLADPVAAIRNVDGNLFMGLAMAAAVGYNATYPELQLSKYLNTAGKWLFDNKGLRMCQELIPTFTMQRIAWYTKKNPFNQPDWRARFRENALGKVAPAMPVFLYHGRLDQALSFHQTTGLRAKWCGEGANVRTTIYPYTEHFTTQMAAEPAALKWLADRFAGKPAVKNC
jgi:pimeloyl-ACP methyl ester carboxylesterase